MRVVHLSPGAGDSFYCENCLRDATLVQALRRRGHDAASLPLYLPLMIEETLDDRADGEVFFGGINVYLQQKFALFRHTPRWLDKLFDSRRLLRWAGRKAGMTDAKEVGETMLSMLRGEQGRQVKELDRLVAFLTAHERADAISLSNILLTGLVRRTKEALGVPVVASCQDEAGYVDDLPEPYRSQAWELLAERGADVDAFVAPSRFYADELARRLDLPPERFTVIPHAIDASASAAPAEAPPDRPTVGYLSQMCPSKGLDTLVEAFLILRASGRVDAPRLRVFGGATEADAAFLDGIRRRINKAGAGEDIEFARSFRPEHKGDFLRSCSALSVPTRRGEAFGYFVLEAWAAGLPVVLPDHGGFSELVRDTGAGLLCEPNDPEDLAAKLGDVLADPPRAAEMGRLGRQATLDRYGADRMAADVEALLTDLIPSARTTP